MSGRWHSIAKAGRICRRCVRIVCSMQAGLRRLEQAWTKNRKSRQESFRWCCVRPVRRGGRVSGRKRPPTSRFNSATFVGVERGVATSSGDGSFVAWTNCVANRPTPPRRRSERFWTTVSRVGGAAAPVSPLSLGRGSGCGSLPCGHGLRDYVKRRSEIRSPRSDRAHSDRRFPTSDLFVFVLSRARRAAYLACVAAGAAALSALALRSAFICSSCLRWASVSTVVRTFSHAAL